MDYNADPLVSSDSGNTALHTAAYRGDVVIADLLIKIGTSFDEIDDNGNAPLHGAASRGQVEMVKFFLSKRAVADKKNKNGQTPLSLQELRIIPTV
ncbi:MAG: ankyrin repeat domain-containing protein [Deltaproteobacteria bacterium]|nr:ankyrin repeat domain-containing protein [Deltaproteobacteria bacterium]